MIRPNITKGTRVQLVIPINAFAGIDPDPVPPGTEGTVEYGEGNFFTVQWDTGYSSGVLFDDLKIL